jgi:hypothetical protein
MPQYAGHHPRAPRPSEGRSCRWLSNTREKLAKPTSAGASLMPAEYVCGEGRAQNGTSEFSIDDDDTANS